MKFWAGQYVDITVTPRKGRRLRARSPWQIRRAKPQTLRFIIKKYPERRVLRPARLGGIARRRRRRSSKDPTEPASGGRTETEPDGAGRRRLGHVADLVDPARSHGQRRAAAGLLLLRRPHARRPVLPRPELRRDRGAAQGLHIHPGAVARGGGRRAGTGERGFVHERVGAMLKELASTVRSTSTPVGRRR